MTRWTVALLAALSFHFAHVAAVEACMNGYIMDTDEATQKVAQAQKALDAGKPQRALALLDAEHYEVPPALMRRITLVKAVAHARVGKTKRAERVLRRLLVKNPDDPVLKTRLAEALARRKGDDPVEAWQILSDLEKRDLIPDAHGYATLASLRRRANDLEGFERAMRRCRAMAKSPSICRAESPRGGRHTAQR